MIERKTLEAVSMATGRPIVALPSIWDPALVGYVCQPGYVVAVYDYDIGRLLFHVTPEDYDDILLDALRAARLAYNLEPLIIHTRNN